jgi:SpoIIAA-like
LITIQNEDNLGIVAVFGEFELADYKRFEEEVSRLLQSQGRINLLVDLRDMVDYTVDVALEDIRFTRAHAHERGRIAILSERETVRWIALLSQLFLDANVQVFGDEATARDWLAGE